jgi:hypothetical protein
MIEESRLRRIIRGILIREMKDTGSGSGMGEPIMSKNMPVVSPMSPAGAALKLLTVARNNSKILGEELSMAVWASRHDPEKLLALTRTVLGMDSSPRYMSVEVEIIRDEIEKMYPSERSPYEPL